MTPLDVASVRTVSVGRVGQRARGLATALAAGCVGLGGGAGWAGAGLPVLGIHSTQTSGASGTNGALNAYPLNSPPINGFIPQVVVTMTDQQAPNDFSFAAKKSSDPGGNPLGGGYKFLATLDTGSDSHILSYDATTHVDFEGANREGSSDPQQVGGANGTEDVYVTDAVGVYVTGIQNATSSGGTIQTTGPWTGQWNTAVLTATEGSIIPNLIGSPMVAQYQAVVSNSQTRRLQVGSTVARSPQVSFQNLNTALPAGYSKLVVSVKSVNGVQATPAYFPSLSGSSGSVADDPILPTFWAYMFANATLTKTATTTDEFLFDTGAQVTVLSEQTAANAGIFVGDPNTVPDFTVEVAGVGGVSTVPGFFLPEFKLTTTAGILTWTNVPIIVYDLIDPRDGEGAVPGIIGTNLFTDRDLIINGGTSSPFVGIGPQLTARWATNGDGTWGEDAKWVMGAPSEADLPANFLGDITAPRTITVDGDYTLGSMTFDNANNRYTIAGPGRLTLQTTVGQANIHVVTGSHTIGAPMTFASPTRIAVDRAQDTLTMGAITAGGVATAKAGPGTLRLTAAGTFGAVTVEQGKLALAPGLGKATRLAALTIAGGASVDISGNGLVVGKSGGTTLASLVAAIGAAYDRGRWDHAGLGSSAAAADLRTATAVGVADNAALGYLMFDGLNVTADDLLVHLTWYGDANLDGKVDNADRLRFASAGAAATWATGDFNFDGLVTPDDYALFEWGAAQQTGSFPVVPEPVGVGIWVVTAGVGMGLRRRRG